MRTGASARALGARRIAAQPHPRPPPRQARRPPRAQPPPHGRIDGSSAARLGAPAQGPRPSADPRRTADPQPAPRRLDAAPPRRAPPARRPPHTDGGPWPRRARAGPHPPHGRKLRRRGRSQARRPEAGGAPHADRPPLASHDHDLVPSCLRSALTPRPRIKQARRYGGIALFWISNFMHHPPNPCMFSPFCI